MQTVKDRLNILRANLKNERLSYDDLVELQGYAASGDIPEDDVRLLEAAGVPEFLENEERDGITRKHVREFCEVCQEIFAGGWHPDDVLDGYADNPLLGPVMDRITASTTKAFHEFGEEVYKIGNAATEKYWENNGKNNQEN